MGRLVGREFAEAIADPKAEARAAGLTDTEINAEPEAYNMEQHSGFGGCSWSAHLPR